MPTNPTLLNPGQIVGEKYKVRRLIGKGGMGVVYEAEHMWTNRRVALKILLTDGRPGKDAVQRFLREARAAANIRHANVVDVLDMGADEEHGAYMVMEFLEGESLAQRLKRREKLSGTDTLALLMPVLEALHVAHEQGLVHRDLKPDNIFITTTTRGHALPKILDFGIAKVSHETDSMLTVKTAEGALMGTPYYMSPEQCRGQLDIDRRGDIWAMGTIIYECLTGVRPFQGANLSVTIGLILDNEYRLLSKTAEGRNYPIIAECVKRCLLRDRNARYRDAAELMDDLKESPAWSGTNLRVVTPGKANLMISDNPPVIRGPSSMGPGTRTTLEDAAHRKRLAFAVAGVLTLAVAVFFTVYSLSSSSTPPVEQKATPVSAAAPTPTADASAQGPAPDPSDAPVEGADTQELEAQESDAEEAMEFGEEEIAENDDADSKEEERSESSRDRKRRKRKNRNRTETDEQDPPAAKPEPKKPSLSDVTREY